MNTYLVSHSNSPPALADEQFLPVARQSAARRGIGVPALEAVALLALLLAGGTLALSPMGGYTAPRPAVDVATLPSPPDFTSVPPDASAAVLGTVLIGPSQRAWTTAEDPFAALDTMVATLKSTGWTVEDAPAGGILSSMPHLARLRRPNAQLLLSAWRGTADSLTRIVATVEP